MVLGWTVPWARLASLLPQPCSQGHINAMREKLLEHWAKGEQVMNPYMTGSRCLSVTSNGFAAAARKIDVLAGNVHGIMTRAAQGACVRALASGDLDGAMRAVCGRGLPFGGYADKSARYMCRVLGVADSRASDALCMASGAYRGLAHVAGGDPVRYAKDPRAAREALRVIKDRLRSTWFSTGGPAVNLPVLHPWELSEMLCIWARARFKEDALPKSRVTRGLGIPVRGQVPGNE